MRPENLSMASIIIKGAAICALVLSTWCCSPDVPAPVEAAVPQGEPSGGLVLAGCGLCPDVSGSADVFNLCFSSPSSWAHWSAMVDCICNTGCAAACGSDWCARLGDAVYSDASEICNACAASACITELLACDADDPGGGGP